MKKLLVLFILFVCTTSVNIKAQDEIDVVVESLCNCVTQKQDSAKKNNINLDATTELQACILGAIVENIKIIKEKYGNAFSLDSDEGKKLGEEIGFKAATKCPAFLSLIAQSEEVMDEVKADIKENREAKEKTLTKTGRVEKVKSKPWFTVTFDVDGRKEKYIVVKNGVGIADFVSNYKKYFGRLVTIEYTISELYNAKKEEFELKKEILSIKVEK
jgi:hypothetical protein